MNYCGIARLQRYAYALRAGLIMFYTYVLISKKDNKIYIGWTIDLKKRIIKHNSGLVESTKVRRPLKLIYYEACLNKKSAIEREKSLKTGFGRAYLKKRLS
jgi:putative endonuclease